MSESVPTPPISPSEKHSDLSVNDQSQKPETKDATVVNSPSLSSVSSANSDNSTNELIKSLSSNKLSDGKEEEVPEDSGKKEEENVAESTTPIITQVTEATRQETLPLPKPNAQAKKPIRFTVRKVSHEPVDGPKLSPSLNSSKNTSAKASPALSSSQEGSDASKSKSNRNSSGSGSNINIARLDYSKTRVVDPTGEEATREREKLNKAQHKYDSYENRIRKIDKEIEFLTKLLPPYNVEIDYATRTKITKAVEKLRMKQDEIEKKKYSLGITISRLWRGHEGTDIWVRSFSQ
ncbi:hypothetical protein G9P44_001059 [Scheffersomyces stipitis]|nr:hypothetical protein G9P44_001059 [Scheffersomyces stipitis]